MGVDEAWTHRSVSSVREIDQQGAGRAAHRLFDLRDPVFFNKNFARTR
jgi:hypothetical protein